ncbi:uncharacterized protein LOC129906669 [Episyrphus balteatus]|uniref:uncharacterized protein LOC129906669 n=1 Tax=Episyrphus balteatus TaxID=286459 RepID=UPI002484EF4C|nr:uncharacterized protein LOC129906669 [Episyrphus balteatus]
MFFFIYSFFVLKTSGQSTEMNFEEALIDAIQRHECLFHKDSIFYRKKNVKQKAWNKVASETGASVKECQHRWRSLRDRFVRETRAKSQCKWRYMNRLVFLMPHLDSRERKRSSTAICKTKNEGEEEEEESCSETGGYATVDYELTPSYLEESIDNSLLTVPKIKKPKLENNIDVEQEKIAIVSIPSMPSAYVSTEFCNTPEMTAPTTSKKITTKIEPKRRRVDSQEYDERSRNSFEYVEEYEDFEEQPKKTPTKSRNEDYYKTLDSYMLRLPQDVQDDLKIEILNRVYSEIKKQ